MRSLLLKKVCKLRLYIIAVAPAPGIDAYGATLVGIPVLAIAFNDNLGWTHTVNTFDGWDAYETSGWLQNTNDPPWTTTFLPTIDANNYPAYIAPHSMSFRAQRSAKMLFEDKKISFDEMVAYKHSTRMELGDRLLEEDDLLPAANKYGNKIAKHAAKVLQTWDRQANAVAVQYCLPCGCKQ